MEIIEQGHEYALKDFAGEADNQILKFIKKAPVSPGSTEMEVVMHGTTNEAVLEVLIDRLTYLQEKMPCEENLAALANLKSALEILNERTAKRKERGVEGTHQA